MKEFSDDVLAGYIKAFFYVFGPPLIIFLLAVLFPSWLSIMTAIIISTFYLPIATFFTVYLFLAPQAICFIFAIENIAILIKRGGKVVDVVYVSNIYDIENFKVIDKKNKDDWIKTKFGGLTFYGITPNKDVYFLTIKYNKLIEKEIEEDGKTVKKYYVLKRETWTSQIDLKKMNYAMSFSGMETRDKASVYAITSLTLRVINVYAFVEYRNIYEMLEEILLAEFKDFVKRYKYDEIVGRKDEFGRLGEIFYKELEKEGVLKKINKMGFETYLFMVLEIDSENKDIEKSSRSLYLAEKEKQIKILEAQGDAAGLETIVEVCKKYNIPPALVLLIQKIGPSEANYLFWQGNFLQETMQKLDKNVIVDEEFKENVKRLLALMAKK